ncbi:hypothetical protein ED733_005474 [Metarhizium rileyi]|uniref:Trichome differentiation protein GL1 n=1 Tax=Metarhizium rileyi (strain RCEF 4871) TaxID=1649241 RepID=A0A5C6GBK8_METRR|nr:hypothetical protein ED733_005474 [Metarhizium rileyi]
MNTRHRRGPWSNTEDRFLMALIESHGPLNWVRIAQILGSRTPKQCRERYHQNLKPTLNHSPITPEEGVKIESLVQVVGKRWAEIARRLNGRSDNAVKNWWNGSQNRRKRINRRRAQKELAAAAPSSTSPSPSLSYDHSMQRAPLSIVSPMLPTSHSIYPASPRPGRSDRVGSWVVPLPSPCFSEPPHSDLDSSRIYTTTPAGQPHSPRSRFAQIELPPIRGWPEPIPSESQLPRISPLGRGEPGVSSKSTPAAPLPSSFELMTAPNSPVPQQVDSEDKVQARGQSYPEPQRSPRAYSRKIVASEASVDHANSDRSNMMKLASLLT